jgi:heat-inducible transcriptional repressor
MTTPHLDERRSQVLKSLIDIHIASGEPVGSKSLSQALGRTLSSATIRAVMAELERMGYLDHPHTSAGRMPTDEGYRVYVDSLMNQGELTPADASAIESGLCAGAAAPAEVLEKASRLLSRLSRNVGFVLAPDIGRARFRHIDLVRLPHPRILVVMVSATGLLTNKMIEVQDQISPEELQACANYLNTHYAGMTLSGIRARLVELMGREKALYDSLLKRVVSIGERAFAGEADDSHVFLDGAFHMLDKPEFEDLDRMRTLFKTFEEKSRLVKILTACISGEGVRVIIGHENPEPDLQDLALVTAGCPLEGESGWGVGVLGSTRMEYARMIGLVDRVARTVADALAETRR